MNKKFYLIISILLASVLFICGAFLIINNLGDTVVALGSKKAAVGETVEIPLSIDKNKGIWGGQIIIKYDSDSLSFVSCENAGVFDGCEVNNNEGEVVILVTQNELENTKKDGDVAKLKFKAKISADAGDYDITIDENTNFCNVNEEIIDVTLKNGKISVK